MARFCEDLLIVFRLAKRLNVFLFTLISTSCLPPRGHPYGHLRWVSQWPPPMGPQWPYKKILTKENMNKCGPSMATSSGHPMVYRLATSTRDLLHMFIHEIYVVVPFTKIVLISFVGMLLHTL